ncbi:MAG: GTPase Era [Bacteroidota bacterium]|nr:GTPase Era [Bacteroidota bacterium]
MREIHRVMENAAEARETATTEGSGKESIPFRCGVAAVIGEPNVGKSTFLNAVLGSRLSIVTPKPQTTRRRILGIHNGPGYQLVLVDTPGILKPAYLLQESMLENAKRAAAGCDVLLLLIDAGRALERDAPFGENVSEILAGFRAPAVAAVNKIDLIERKELLLPVIDRLRNAFAFRAVVPMSALTGDGVDDVVRVLVALLPEHPPLYPQDMLSDLPERFFVGEIIREKIFELFREEIPYATEVFITEYREDDQLDFISAEILVERDSQKRILIGRGGSAIREIGTRARADIEHFLGRKVFLDLHVKVREKWRNSEAWIRRLGYHR